MSARQVAALLTGLDESVQANRQGREGTPPPDRKAQCDYLNEHVKAVQARQHPISSVDTTKKA